MDLLQLPSTFYRVSIKALIFDDQERLLVYLDTRGMYEMPGGGWEYDEDFATCLRRELQEEAGLVVSAIKQVQFTYTQRNEEQVSKLFIAVAVAVEPSTPQPLEAELAETRFVTRDEFIALPWQLAEAGVTAYVDQIWPVD